MMEKTETILRPWRNAPISQAARKIGRSKSHIWRVIRGERKPGRALAKVLAEMGLIANTQEAAQ